MPIVATDIATKRLMLMLSYDAVPEHVEWLNDNKLMKWSEQRYREHTIETQQDFLDEADAAGNPLVWDIRLPYEALEQKPRLRIEGEIGSPIGSLHAYCNERHKRVDLGIMLGPQYHGEGYAAEAWSAVCDYLAYKHGMRKFEAGFVDGNIPILKMLMRLGGWHTECRRENHFIIGGQSYGLVLWGRTYSQ
jgi:RimJ/RimL family protein N-acetyltransferase